MIDEARINQIRGRYETFFDSRLSFVTDIGFLLGVIDTLRPQKVERDHEAYADPIGGGWDGYQAACWDCDWRSPTTHPTGRDGKSAAQEEAIVHRRNNRGWFDV